MAKGQDSDYLSVPSGMKDDQTGGHDIKAIEGALNDSTSTWTKSDDVEAQTHSEGKKANAPEYGIPTSTKYLYLGLYFALNLVLTLYNKAVLGEVCQP